MAAVKKRILDAPQAPRLPSNEGAIPSRLRTETIGAWVFATIWNLIAIPLLVSFLAHARGWEFAIVSLFSAAGIALFGRAVGSTYRYVRFGETRLSLDPPQPGVGQTLTVRIRFDKEPPSGLFLVALMCESVDSRGDDTRRKTVWRDDVLVPARAGQVIASFSPPASVPPSEPDAPVHHAWRVSLEFPEPSSHTRAFDIVVSPPREGATPEPIRPARAPSSSIPSRVARITETAEGLTVDFDPRGWRSAALGAAIIGGCLLAFAMAMRQSPVGAIYCGALGAAALVIAVFLAPLHYRVRIADGSLTYRKRGLLGARVLEIPASDIVMLTPLLRNDEYAILARRRNGAVIEIGDTVRSRSAAETLLEIYRRHLRMRTAATAVADATAEPFPLSPEDDHRYARNRKILLAGFAILMIVVLVAQFATMWL